MEIFKGNLSANYLELQFLLKKIVLTLLFTLEYGN